MPLVLEIGCGRGEYTLELAKLHHRRLFVGTAYLVLVIAVENVTRLAGLDKKGSRLFAGIRTAELLNLPNVAFLRGDLALLGAYFAPGEVDEIWITFPEPQARPALRALCIRSAAP